ncbi:hypothetical protein EJ06DRAFT_559487 [Trichodelitschia bisporula]|uniref:ribonuclease T1 n=1 Tax=Trichodelitschia bisporula TaxID=703511 RepID=A0A6G1HLY5_9PEZI|nr:hypothetical protein EJ06DRAFT_559487 [Trichodelitschia bisporula]
MAVKIFLALLPLALASPQWGNWGNWGAQQQSPRPQQNQPWAQQTSPRWGNQPATQAQPWNNAPQPQTQPWNNAPRPQTQYPRPTQQPRPTAQPRPADDDDEPLTKWTAPAQWGPKGTRPFGPRTTTVYGTPGALPPSPTREPEPAGPTSTDPPKEPVPFVVTCGRTRYVEDDISNALTAGCFYQKKGTKVNGSEFPKEFVNNQGFDFGELRAPFYEFPIIPSAPYVGGPAGNDRVVFSAGTCYLAGELVYQNGKYTECSEEY